MCPRRRKPRRITADRRGDPFGSGVGGVESHIWQADDSRAAIPPAPEWFAGEINPTAGD